MPSQSGLHYLFQQLIHDHLLWVLLLVLAGLTVAAPARVTTYPSLVDWPTMATLTGLLILTKGVELSGWLERLAQRLIARMRSQRRLALLLVTATALLATVLTNDVALFVVVPLTLVLRRPAAAAKAAGEGDAAAGTSALPVTRLIIFEALAANAGSTLTPIGNPQNLYLWQQSQVSFGSFTLAMLPLALGLLGALWMLTACSFSAAPNVMQDADADADANADADAEAGADAGANPEPAASSPGAGKPVERGLLLTSLALYLPFLALTDLHRAPLALACVSGIFLLAYRRVLARVDWPLLLVFMLMFIDLRLIAATEPVRMLLAGADLGHAVHLFLVAVGASQVISNVPAAILLAQYSHDWQVLAYGVNVGGAGLAIGSLANIIALRMAGERRAWLVFHAYSIPFLAVTGAAVLAWLAWR